MNSSKKLRAASPATHESGEQPAIVHQRVSQREALMLYRQATGRPLRGEPTDAELVAVAEYLVGAGFELLWDVEAARRHLTGRAAAVGLTPEALAAPVKPR